MATAAGIVNFKLPDNAGEDSYDLLPALLGRAHAPIWKAVVHHSNSGVFSIREENWKLELGLGSGGFSEPNHIDRFRCEVQGRGTVAGTSWLSVNRGQAESPNSSPMK